jgi:hypothetical protein
VLQALIYLIWVPRVPFLPSAPLFAQHTIGTICPKSPITLKCLFSSSSLYGTITCVPSLAILDTRYRPKKPVQPKTVTVWPDTDDRPPVAGPCLMIGVGVPPRGLFWMMRSCANWHIQLQVGTGAGRNIPVLSRTEERP